MMRLSRSKANKRVQARLKAHALHGTYYTSDSKVVQRVRTGGYRAPGSAKRM